MALETFKIINQLTPVCLQNLVNVKKSKYSFRGVRSKTRWLGIRIMCPSGATCTPTDCCVGELASINIQLIVLV